MTCRCCTTTRPCLPLGLCTQPSRAPTQKQEETRMKRIVLAVAMIAVGVTAVVAQSDPIAARKALMKANNDNASNLVKMMRGEDTVRRGQGQCGVRPMGRDRSEVPGFVPRQFEDRWEHPRDTENLGNPKRFRGEGRGVRQGRGRQSRQGQECSTRSRSPWPPWARPATDATSNIAPGSADRFNRLVSWPSHLPVRRPCHVCSEGPYSPSALKFYRPCFLQTAELPLCVYRRHDVGRHMGGFGPVFFHKYYPARTG